MNRRDGGGRGRGGGGGGYSSRGRGKKLRGARGSRRIATAEEVEARNAELSRPGDQIGSSSSGEESDEQQHRGDGPGRQRGKEKAETKHTATDSSSEESDDQKNPSGKGGGGGQMKFKRPLDFLREQKRQAGQEESSEESDDDLATSMGRLQVNQGPQLTRREREAIEQQRRQRRYEKLHAEGKTPEAKADLARLAEVRQRREEAARLRAEGGG